MALLMPETAKYLGEANIDKTIVLFGASIPANKDKSDVLFNLGAAFLAVQLLSPGVYVVIEKIRRIREKIHD